jgi:hypothetical protein
VLLRNTPIPLLGSRSLVSCGYPGAVVQRPSGWIPLTLAKAAFANMDADDLSDSCAGDSDELSSDDSVVTELCKRGCNLQYDYQSVRLGIGEFSCLACLCGVCAAVSAFIKLTPGVVDQH